MFFSAFFWRPVRLPFRFSPDAAGRRTETLPDDAPAEDIQNEVYAVGKAHFEDNLRGWFQTLYQVLLGQDQGPRFGSFVALYGLKNSAKAWFDTFAESLKGLGYSQSHYDECLWEYKKKSENDVAKKNYYTNRKNSSIGTLS